MNEDKLKELKKNIYITIPIDESTRQTVLDLIKYVRQLEKDLTVSKAYAGGFEGELLSLRIAKTELLAALKPFAKYVEVGPSASLPVMDDYFAAQKAHTKHSTDTEGE